MFIQWNAFENTAREILAILVMPKYDNTTENWDV